ncbi:MAG: V-type ATP synthase subunit D [Candidatus Scalindua sp.]|jgi:V/A-type H+-transporting ATPase subunit D|nr:V-type ATP synthase subunit D [Candidatus Scalindua sp.]MBT5307037.1 V-type ATP synthase subunit D [Candidatus Scalindua sp.]MBT6050224.1 V-type ATP synthase subunit D [Candidatus Scalindua sp.]MBT6227249.1 V-type ATP synthase subunit D [Candidatus Scalindua sp.]MBT6564560.1 V-type ATP synthase subunit D [Candidatus Scalindua sp.]
MRKIKLTKAELKNQNDNLKRYNRYLPILYIKKQQLQKEIEKLRIELKRITFESNKLRDEIIPWVSLLGEEVGLSDLVMLKEIKTSTENIAGVVVPVFVKAHIDIEKYDLFKYPLWVDNAVGVISKMISFQAEESVVVERLRLLEQELYITSQRINLFEKIMIPETKAAIRKISIFLGDQRAAAVGWARIAKKKMQGVR